MELISTSKLALSFPVSFTALFRSVCGVPAKNWVVSVVGKGKLSHIKIEHVYLWREGVIK